MANIVQYIVVYRLPDVPDRPLHIGRRYDLMSPCCVLIGRQDTDLPPGHFLFMDVHRLWKKQQQTNRCEVNAKCLSVVKHGPLGFVELAIRQLDEV